MGSRFPSHQLSNGLYVSGRPEQPKEKPPTMMSGAVPYTGGDIKKSGELGKMFDVPYDASKSKKSGQLSGVLANPAGRGSFSASGPPSSGGSGPNSVPNVASMNRQRSNSGPLNKHGEYVKKTSGPLRQNSGPLAPVLPATGLITSGPISSGPLNSSGMPRKKSGPLDSSAPVKLPSFSVTHNQAVTKLTEEEDYSFKRNFPKPILWSVILLFVMGFIAGGFILGAVRNGVLLIVVAVLFAAVVSVFTWNSCWGKRAITGFLAGYPDAELRSAKNGQYVKVSGVVTCGNVPLESSFLKVPRCIYTSTSLYEYKGWDLKAAASAKNRSFTWGLRSLERHVVDFYISDFQSGLRALVKAGYGARVTPYVEESAVVDIDKNNKALSPEFIRWLGERNLSCDDRIMRLKEGYIKEGSTVSVMGMVQRNDNILMIVPPPEPFSTGCQWAKCLLPATLEGIILRCEDSSKADVIPV
ncbi:uncharacterized membrane protein At1g16860-like [Nymphaea colorata]|nr:uncharacterized membrane protein At1g16860-like [Nymphaea colorata]XP_031477951.1 uncharacterized membrane protein At1g16860-like [Nymphaea colorata]XP_031477952.1 uncharacterized membrane protein At1g16860-like [Nymphaea colorata]